MQQSELCRSMYALGGLASESLMVIDYPTDKTTQCYLKAHPNSKNGITIWCNNHNCVVAEYVKHE